MILLLFIYFGSKFEDIVCGWQMTSERQRIEAAPRPPPPPPSVDSMPPPPPYEEVDNSNVFTSPRHNGSINGMEYFLGEVSQLLYLHWHLNVINIFCSWTGLFIAYFFFHLTAGNVLISSWIWCGACFVHWWLCCCQKGLRSACIKYICMYIYRYVCI